MMVATDEDKDMCVSVTQGDQLMSITEDKNMMGTLHRKQQQYFRQACV